MHPLQLQHLPVLHSWKSSVCSQDGTAFSGSYGALPSCTSPTPHWNGGAGVIMSYCQHVGGFDAVAMTFGGPAANGQNHTCGTLPYARGKGKRTLARTFPWLRPCRTPCRSPCLAAAPACRRGAGACR